MEEYSSPGLTPDQLAALSNTIMIVAIIIFVIATIACWRIYVKAGESGWKAIIPIYNCVVWQKIIGKPVWWVAFLILPYLFMILMKLAPSNHIWPTLYLLTCIVSMIFAVWMTNLMVKSFGKGVGFTFGMVLLPFIFFPILAYGPYQYIGPAGNTERN